MKYLVVGLGNVGNEYAHTRHNIGFDVVNAFVLKHGGSFTNGRLAYMAETKFRGKKIICICPTTYMNLSGNAVRYWMGKENVQIDNILVVLDDVALPLSKLRLRPGGNDGGHNGLKNINAILETNNYPRLRFGIGNDYPRGLQADFVLSKWRKEEEPLVKLKIDKSAEVIETFVFAGITTAMNMVNNKEFSL